MISTIDQAHRNASSRAPRGARTVEKERKQNGVIDKSLEQARQIK
jgi:hypothetical protein